MTERSPTPVNNSSGHHHSSHSSHHGGHVHNLCLGGTFIIPQSVSCVRLSAVWTSAIHGLICDLDLAVYIYDERARFVEKLTADSCVSLDKSAELLNDIDSITKDSSHVEYVKVDLAMVSKQVSCMLLFLDGGPRNFKHVQSVKIHVEELVVDRDSSFASSGRSEPRSSLLEMVQRTRRDSQGVAVCVLYRRFYPDGSVTWELRSLFEPLFVSTMRDKDEKVGHIIVNHVPSLEKFRPRLFQSVKAICSALSSKALPLLKDKFAGSGLPIDSFVETIFKQLFEQSPKLSDPSEAEYLVAMLYDMFSQIDLNGDGSVDWDEFTSFTINVGIDASDRSMADLDGAEAGGSMNKGDTTGANQHRNTLDEYIIEYGESSSFQSYHTFQELTAVRHFPEAGRIVVVPEGSDKAIFFDHRGKEVNRFYPAKAEATVITEMADMEKKAIPHGNTEKALTVYDCIYLNGRDLYAYTASDHSIGICKEKNILGGTKKGVFDMYNKIIFSNIVHVKLCWSQKSNILCSVAANNDIHGWNIDNGAQLFVISRHSDVVTDILALDEKELFATCSLDKRVVLWSMSSRRVKGVLIGHKRGIRCMSVARNTLLTAGFECEAKTWNLTLKEIALTLKGHRFPITAARIMALESGNDEDLRAITVDESHELRLWSVHLKERASEAALAPVLQIFTPKATLSKNNPFKAIVFPYNEHASKGYYSDFFAFGKNVHYFTAEKETQEYVPPTCFAFNDAAGSLSTSIRQNLLKYDISSGQFSSIFYNVNVADITAMCFDDERGRKLYIGCGNGEVMIVNYTTGAVMTTFPAHSKEVTRLFSIPANDAVMQSYNLIASGSLDGKFKVIEETAGELTVVFMNENPFTDGSSVNQIRGILSTRILGVASNSVHWAIWSVAHYKRLLLVREDYPILDFEFIHQPLVDDSSTALDSYDLGEDPTLSPYANSPTKAQNTADDIVIAAVAVANAVNIYCVDTVEGKVIYSHKLVHPDAFYISNLVSLRCNEENNVNYLSSRNAGDKMKLGQFLVGGTDDGRIIAWNVDDVYTQAVNKYRMMYPFGGGAAKARPALPTGRRALLVGSSHDEEDEEDRAASAPKGVDTSKTGRKNAVKTRIYLTVPREIALDFETRSSHLSWKAHQDFIAGVWPLHNEGCIITLSHDGYHRVWNMDRECLGELMLTNLTDEMKAKSMILGMQHAWKFVQERIPISDMHKQIARDFIRIMLTTGDGKKRTKGSNKNSRNASGATSPLAIDTLSHSHDSGDGGSPIHSQMHASVDSTEFAEAVSKLMLRNDKINEARHPSVDDSGRVEFDESLVLSPIRVSSPGRSRTASFNTEDNGSHFSGGEHDKDDDASRATQSPKKDGSPKSASQSPSRRHGHDKRKKPVWIKASETGFANAAAPFSEASISLSKQFGAIDTETQQMLRTIGRNKNTVRAYDRIVPPLYLRSSSVATGIEVPKIDNIETAEVMFGTQRTIYKNATEHCKSKYLSQSSKVKAHHHIAMHRIQQKTKNVGSMIHIARNHAAEEVVIPPDSGETTKEDLDESEGRGPPGSKRITKLPKSSIYSLAPVGSNIFSLRAAQGSAAFSASTLKGLALGLKGTITFADVGKTQQFGAEHEEALKNEMALNAMYRRRSSTFRGSQLTASATGDDDPFADDSGSDGEEAIPTQLNLGKISSLMTKIDSIVSEGAQYWDKSSKARRLMQRHKRKLKSLDSSSMSKMMSLERGLANAIKQVFRIVGPDVELVVQPPKPLTNRMLLPFYKLDDVQNFLEVFNKVDVDFSGDLDPLEWANFFSAMNRAVTFQEAQVMFLKLDTNGDGVLSIRELVPLVFDKAKKEQMKLILHYVESEVMKKQHQARESFTAVELETLFDFYDADVVGFVAVNVIRERVRTMHLPQDAEDYIFKIMEHMEDDEMVNPIEFNRIFEAFLPRPHYHVKRSMLI